MTQRHPLFEPLLDRLGSDPRRYFGSDDVSFDTLAVHLRRGSHLLHVRVRTRDEEYGAFLKIYKKADDRPDTLSRLEARVNRDYATTLNIHRAFHQDTSLGAVYPIAVFPDHLAIMTREAPGLPLGRTIEERVRWRRTASGIEDLLRTLHDTGRWLARFQTIGRCADLAPLRLDDVLEYVDVRLHKLLRAQAISAADRTAVRTGIEHRWPDISPGELVAVPIHADYCLGNVLVDGRRVVVLDFAMTRTGAIYHDLSHMFLQLQLMQSKPWFRPPVVNRLCGALLDGFSPTVRAEAPLFQVLTIQHVVNHLTKLTIRPARRAIARPYNWLVRRRHLTWLRDSGCLDARRTA